MAGTQNKLAFARILGLLLAAMLIVPAGSATMQAWRRAGDFDRWMSDRPVDAEVDYSKPGVTTLAFHQTCQTAHAEEVVLAVEGADSVPTNVLEGLVGTMSTGCNGMAMEKVELKDIAAIDDRAGSHVFLISRFAPFVTGDYTLNIQIDHPAPGLAGRRQRLTARYLLCGMEKLPEIISTFMAVAWWLLVLLLVVPNVIGRRKYGWRVKPRVF